MTRQEIRELLEILGMPNRTRNVVIRIPCDGQITIEYEAYAEDYKIKTFLQTLGSVYQAPPPNPIPAPEPDVIGRKAL